MILTTTFTREMKYPKTYHMDFSPGTTKGDKKMPKGWFDKYFKGKEVVLTEKLDGENTSFTNQGVYARSDAPTDSPWSVNLRMDYPYIKNYLSDNEIVFGENLYGIHSIRYDKLTSYWHMFAMFNTEQQIWYSWDDVELMANILNRPTVPVLFRGVINSEDELISLINKFMSQPSTYGVEKEGIVMRLTSEIKPEKFTESVVKYVRPNHVQTTIHWTKDWKKAELINNK